MPIPCAAYVFDIFMFETVVYRIFGSSALVKCIYFCKTFLTLFHLLILKATEWQYFSSLCTLWEGGLLKKF